MARKPSVYKDKTNNMLINRSANDNLDIKQYAIGHNINIKLNNISGKFGQNTPVVKPPKNVDPASEIYGPQKTNSTITIVSGNKPINVDFTDGEVSTTEKISDSYVNKDVEYETVDDPNYPPCECEPCDGVCCIYDNESRSILITGETPPQPSYPPSASPIPEFFPNYGDNSYDKMLASLDLLSFTGVDAWMKDNGWIVETSINDDGTVGVSATCYGQISTTSQFNSPIIPIQYGTISGFYPPYTCDKIGDKICDDTIKSQYECDIIGGTWYPYLTCDDEPCVTPSPSPSESPEPSPSTSVEPSPSPSENPEPSPS